MKVKRFLHFAPAMLLIFGLVAGVTTTAAQAASTQAVFGTIDIGTTSATPTVIGFGGREWVVIGYSGEGIASETYSMTLLAKDSIGETTFKQFYPQTFNYSGSDLEKAINDFTDDFETFELGLILPRTLSGGSTDYLQPDQGYMPDNIAGPDVQNALLWPLSVTEANLMLQSVRNTGSIWWLRTPGYPFQVAVVSDLGYVWPGGNNIDIPKSVRPALSLCVSKLWSHFAYCLVDSHLGCLRNSLLRLM